MSAHPYALPHSTCSRRYTGQRRSRPRPQSYTLCPQRPNGLPLSSMLTTPIPRRRPPLARCDDLMKTYRPPSRRRLADAGVPSPHPRRAPRLRAHITDSAFLDALSQCAAGAPFPPGRARALPPGDSASASHEARCAAFVSSYPVACPSMLSQPREKLAEVHRRLG